jgi:hypothetical protein
LFVLKERKNSSSPFRSADDDEAEFRDDYVQRDPVAAGEVGAGDGEEVVRTKKIVLRVYALFEWFIGAEDGIGSVAFATWLK